MTQKHMFHMEWIGMAHTLGCQHPSGQFQNSISGALPDGKCDGVSWGQLDIIYTENCSYVALIEILVVIG